MVAVQFARERKGLDTMNEVDVERGMRRRKRHSFPMFKFQHFAMAEIMAHRFAVLVQFDAYR